MCSKVKQRSNISYKMPGKVELHGYTGYKITQDTVIHFIIIIMITIIIISLLLQFYDKQRGIILMKNNETLLKK